MGDAGYSNSPSTHAAGLRKLAFMLGCVLWTGEYLTCFLDMLINIIRTGRGVRNVIVSHKINLSKKETKGINTGVGDEH